MEKRHFEESRVSWPLSPETGRNPKLKTEDEYRSQTETFDFRNRKPLARAFFWPWLDWNRTRIGGETAFWRIKSFLTTFARNWEESKTQNRRRISESDWNFDFRNRKPLARAFFWSWLDWNRTRIGGETAFWRIKSFLTTFARNWEESKTQNRRRNRSQTETSTFGIESPWLEHSSGPG